MRLQPSPSVRSEAIGVGSSSLMTTLTSGAAVKGAWASLGTTSFSYNLIQVVTGWHSTGADMLIDLGIDDGAGNVHVIVPDMKISRRAARVLGQAVLLPLHIPAGSAVVARVESGVNTHTVGCSVTGFSAGIGGAPGLARCHRLYTPSSRRGVTVGPGVGTFGNMVQLIAATPGPVEALLLSIDVAGDITRIDQFGLLNIYVGASGSEQMLIENFCLSGDSAVDIMSPYVLGPIPVDIPTGTRVAARAQVATTSSGMGVAVWGLGP